MECRRPWSPKLHFDESEESPGFRHVKSCDIVDEKPGTRTFRRAEVLIGWPPPQIRARIVYNMTTIVESTPFPPATLLDQDGHALTTGEACVDTQSNIAEFFPSRNVDEENLLKRAVILQITGGPYAVRRIERCPAIRLGRANPHYDLTLEPDASGELRSKLSL